jgi:hypothetical protein
MKIIRGQEARKTRKSVGIYKNIKYIIIDMTASPVGLFLIFFILVLSFLTVCYSST